MVRIRPFGGNVVTMIKVKITIVLIFSDIIFFISFYYGIVLCCA